MKKKLNIVAVHTPSHEYDVYIGAGLLKSVCDYIPVDVKNKRFFLIVDGAVSALAKQVQESLLAENADSCFIWELKPGEHNKSMATVEKICGWMLEHKVARDSVLISIGGGVSGDLGGFCASIILRGIPYVQIPTTLLSQVDSSVGGKTGVNSSHGKNLIGAFYQPQSVIIDIDVLKTLPRREILAGYAEIVKYGLINDAEFFQWLESNGQAVIALEQKPLLYAIAKSVQAKADIVSADEKEQGKRALLNLGHTFGHALEAHAKYDGRILHGEAVAIGIICAFDLSALLDFCEKADYERVVSHFEKIGLPIKAKNNKAFQDLDTETMLALMYQDKKVEAGKIKFILVSGVGEAFIENKVPSTLLDKVLLETLGKSAQAKFKTKQAKQSFSSHRVKGLWTSIFSSHS